jgi:splicing factor 3B subunit 3
VIEADNNTLSADTRAQLLNDPSVVNGNSVVLPPEDVGYSKGDGHWAACVQIVDPVHEKTALFTMESFEYKEAPTSVAYVQFHQYPGEEFLLVGTGVEMIASPRSFKCGYIYVYMLKDFGRSMDLVHKTKVDEPPLALLGFQGRVLAGVGRTLLLYDLGQKQLLRKCQAVNAVPNLLTDLQTQGGRIICSDVQDSVTYVVYKHGDNRLLPFADDTVARWTSAAAMIDYETTAGGDKFGNLWMVRCPEKVSEEADEEGAVAHLVHDKAYLQGTSNRLDLVAHFFTQDIPTSIQKVALVAGGKDVLLWAGLQGTIGVLIPFEQREDANFFQSLEEHMRKVDAPIAGRDHLIYRSYYIPVKAIIDGDLIERYMYLPRTTKESIAADLERSVREVERKIGEMRTRFAY